MVRAANISTLVVGGSKLFREGLKKLLAHSHFTVEAECDDLSEAPSLAATHRPRLVIVVDAPHDGRHLRATRDAAPRSRLAVLSRRLSVEELYSAMQAGADAYLLDGISPEALVQALDLAMVGEKVLPTSLVAHILSGQVLPVADDDAFAKVMNRLSAREIQILDCLIRGEPNKAIAVKLDISEASVKVALKGMLRKIGVGNRTQAAVWALEHGFGVPPGDRGGSALG